MNSRYLINNSSEIISPSLILFKEILIENIEKMIQIAGDPARLCPHCKTHKTIEVVKLQLEHGITKHKCATFAEAEMLAEAGIKNIFLAYNIVGPNLNRAVNFLKAYPDVEFCVTADHPTPISQLSEVMQKAGLQIHVMLDIDTGQHRTGIPVSPEAKELYQLISSSEGLLPAGFHVYDGHQGHPTREERTAAIEIEWQKVISFRNDLIESGMDVPRIVAGGTGSFPVYAAKEESFIELSPGTCAYHDSGYGKKYRDLDFTPAAVLITRVVSRPTANRVTLDLGYKAVASDPPAGSRVFIPDIPDAVEVLQNEEHLVIETELANQYSPGDEILIIPTHICPTSALHKEILVVEGGNVSDHWKIYSRDRQITI